jgi:hypothetical protein
MDSSDFGTCVVQKKVSRGLAIYIREKEYVFGIAESVGNLFDIEQRGVTAPLQSRPEALVDRPLKEPYHFFVGHVPRAIGQPIADHAHRQRFLIGGRPRSVVRGAAGLG